MIAFIGVRISWLMLARNMDFICVASSAFSRRARRELDLLRLELPRLLLRLAEELLCPEVAGQDLEAHPDDRQQLVEQRLLVSGERAKRRELENREELVLGRDRPGGRLGRSRLADARYDPQSVRGDAREARRLALPRALTREPFPDRSRSGAPGGKP